jgi:NodT family efflux transporter outer membrane factor (OMF) lipoprotein
MDFMLTPHRPFLPVLVLALSGCAVGPTPRIPAPESLGVPAQFTVVPATATSPETVDLVRWWQAFDDPTLTALVAEGLEANTDIEAAGARVRQARAALRSTRADWWPTVDVGASATRRMGSSAGVINGIDADVTTYDAGFDAAYEVDLFGGVRRSVQASSADLAATEADLHAVQLSIAAEVARIYLDARLAQHRLDIATANLASQDETLQIVDWRVQAGLVGALDLEQARQLRAQTAATIPSREQEYASAVNRLGVLLGKSRAIVEPRLTQSGDPIQIPLAPMPPVALPADVVRRRPDVTSAERSLAAETARIGVREAELYPALRLSGSFGGAGLTWDDIADASIGTLVASVAAPVFAGGRLRAAVEQQRAAAAGALANYRGVVLVALEETENALVAVGTSQRRETELIKAEEAARNATVLARSQYQAGLIDFQSLLEAERGLLTTGDSRATARANRATALVQLYKALGGGWEAAPVPATMTVPTR